MARTRPLARLRLALAVSLAGLGALTGLTAAAVPASADVFDPLERVHTEQVTGDVVTVGNSVLVCPGEPDDAREECVAASRRQNDLNNNRFAMRFADVDEVGATYNSSTAEVRLPGGSRVTYARLSWAGNREGQQCAVGQPRTFPDDAASTDPVRLSVGGGGPSRAVEPEERTTDTRSVGYYSADAVVTGAFTDLPVAGADRDLRVTVGNVFTAEGKGCFGGWSLTLVHTADDAGCDAQRREVVVYDGHVRQGVGDPPQRVDVTGFRATDGTVRAGVTAYEGDNGQVGDRLRVNDTALEDPATGKADNFFASTAQGRLRPDYPNNFSVDAKRVAVPDGVIGPGDTEATLAVSTGAARDADAFLLQGLTLSVPVPSLCLEKSVSPRTARVGDTVEWTLVVRNRSNVDATGVEVTDPGAPDCEQTVGGLAAGASRTLTCTSVVTEDVVNVASVAGRGPGGIELGAVASAAVDVVAPAVQLTKTAVEETVVEGDDARWRLRVENTGDTRLGGVSVDDPLVSDCDREVGALGLRATETWTCSAPVIDDLTNTATVTASAPGGPEVTDSDTASVAVDPAPTGPAVEIDKTAVDRRVDAGGRARWDITVANTGAEPLDDVTVDDPMAPVCDRVVGALEPGEERTYRCGRTVRTGVVNVATVTATGDDGDPVTDTDSAAVRVDGPFSVTVTPSVARTVPGEDVGLRVRVDNDGPAPVAGVTVRVDGADRCDRRLATPLRPGAVRTVRCTVEADEDGDDLRLAATAAGRSAGEPVRATDVVRVPVLVPAIEVAVTRVAAGDGSAARTDVEVENTGETPLDRLRLGIEGVRLCRIPGGALEAGDTTTITCDAVRREVSARVSAQPVLGGDAVGPRVRATATSASTAPDGVDQIGDGGTGTSPSTPTDPGSPYAPGDPDATSPGGFLPDTGASGALLPVALLGAGMLGAGAWLLRRSRRSPSS